MIKVTILLLLSVTFSSMAFAQTKPAAKTGVDVNLRATPAYAEVLLRKTELEAEAEALLMEFTEEYPKVKEIRIELGFLNAEGERLLSVKPADASKLTLALGKLMLRKAEHAAVLKKLQVQYQDGHPSVKKAKRMVEIFEAAIKEILG